jgi:hypothetical protein
LISAIYLQEAKRLCAEGQPDRAWHIIALAYYHLGLNTAPSTAQNTSRAAQLMHAGRTEKIRALVLAALDKIRKDESARSMEDAKDQVVELLRAKRGESPIKDWLNEFDTLVPENTLSGWLRTLRASRPCSITLKVRRGISTKSPCTLRWRCAKQHHDASCA